MGNKREAKVRMEAAQVPCVPGYQGEDQSDAALIKAAEQMGFPLLVKAAAGGGGRGMRRVEKKEGLAEVLASARSEAENAFGSSELILEKLLENARHIEVQVFADCQGNVIHLGERDCSVQRRHQKVIEEAPSPAVSEVLREAIGSAAVTAAREIGYLGAGTVEFMLDDTGEFYFLEMNTRLQVEHPVTEMVTGLDLVAWQLQVAAGEPLPLTQQQVKHSGHAIEARLYAEAPWNGYQPRTGKVLAWQPWLSEGVRYDHGLVGGITDGMDVGGFYDPMLAKVVAWGETREQARRKLVMALENTVLMGFQTNRGFVTKVLSEETFSQGEARTNFLDGYMVDRKPPAIPPEMIALASALLGGLVDLNPSIDPNATDLSRWRINPHPTAIVVSTQEQAQELQTTVLVEGEGKATVKWAEQQIEIQLISTGLEAEVQKIRFACDGIHQSASALWEGQRLHLQMGGWYEVFQEEPPKVVSSAGNKSKESRVLAPMNGRVLAVRVQVGDTVQRGQCLMILEAMKLEHELEAPADGVVANLEVAEGDQVATRQLLMEIVPDQAG